MGQRELFSNIFEAIGDAFHRLSNASTETLLIIVVGIAILAYMVLKR